MSNSLLAQQLIQAVEAADSPAKLLKAVQDLAAARLEEGLPTLIAALGYNNPGVAVAAVDGLIQMGDVAVQPLLDLLDGYNYSARAWAIRALAGIGHPRALDTLLEAAKNDFALSVRRAAARGLGNLRWHELPIEQVPPAQLQVLDVLRVVAQDPEWVVRYAAVVALQGLARAMTLTQPNSIAPILEQLQQVANHDGDLTVRTRARFAQQALREGEQENSEFLSVQETHRS
ncbi:HEAT repeat domain-containing protein [Leptothermofonsia sp. ETS-13]|uniref:HEAT repeat domain-containing protein n=1 Tax=Leptothermofonsia sp. ETS-13 TaxID=3035696 RepID=UPI003B9F13DE